MTALFSLRALNLAARRSTICGMVSPDRLLRNCSSTMLRAAAVCCTCRTCSCTQHPHRSHRYFRLTFQQLMIKDLRLPALDHRRSADTIQRQVIGNIRLYTRGTHCYVMHGRIVGNMSITERHRRSTHWHDMWGTGMGQGV